MKIALVHELFPPDIAGGGETHIERIARELAKRGHNVTVITTGHGTTKERSLIVKRLPVHRYLFNFAVPFILQNARDADVIHCTTFNSALPALVAARLMRKPVICTMMGAYHKKWVVMKGQVVGNIFRAIERVQVNNHFDKMLFLSEFSLKETRWIRREKTEITVPGVDLKRYRVGKKENYVLFVGRMSKQKGIYNLLEAARLLPDVPFKIIGKGEEQERVKKLLPPNVEYLGFVSDEKKYELYAKALIFAYPSVGDGMPATIQEAMAAGCAIVSSVPVDFEGEHLEEIDQATIAKSIRKLFGKRKDCLGYGKKNRRLAESQTWDAYIEKLEKIYEEVTQAGS